ncbi:MAG: hypothetical protein NT023_08730 [Armatimonadetes bacterium]|nr:hypothetical protein [Armatimonadota bacterium]
MARWSRFSQPVTCIFGRHLEPPPRDPSGPIVATCPCCGRAFYSHGYALEMDSHYPNLLVVNFPAIILRPSLEATQEPLQILPE